MRRDVRVVEANKYVRIEPEFILNQRAKWVTNGIDNEYFYYTEQQYINSPTNQAIIDNITNYVMGEGLYDESGKDVSTIIDEEELIKALTDYKIHGSMCLQVIYTLESPKRISKMYHVPTRTVAIYKQEDLSDEIERYWVCFNWKQKSIFKPYEVAAFGYGEDNETEILRIQRQSIQPLFALPDYQSGLQWCEIEAEISNFSNKSIKNGFSAGKVVNIHTGTINALDEEEMELEKKAIINNLTGSENANTVAVAFINSPEEKLSIENIQIDNLHENFISMSEEARSKIMLSHKIPSGSLFGIPNPTGFSSQADEMDMALKLLYRSQINPIRNQVCKYLNWALESVNGEEWSLKFKDFEEKATEENTEESNTEVVSMKKWRRNADSSNVDRVMYNDESNELFVKFNSGSIYTYYDVSFSDFLDLIAPNALATTEGENQWGSWYPGKPSIGAGVHQILEKYNYSKGGNLK
jgi:hypothetical protein